MAKAVERVTFAPLPRTARGVPIKLGADPKGTRYLYVHGNSVVMRDIEDPTKVELYTEHSKQTEVAKYAPSGNYVASGDSMGKVRVWAADNPDRTLKGEYQLFGGGIKDISWSPDSGKILAGGMGKDLFVRCIDYATGTNFGQMNGHTKSVNSVAFKPSRPFAAASAGEDFKVFFYKGPPFKVVTHKNDHSNFVNVVRYAPDGSIFITAGADAKAFIFDGTTGELKGYLGEAAGDEEGKAQTCHGMGIYGLEFSPDGKEVVTVSADKTAKIWNVETRQLVQEFTFGSSLDDMQVGCLWQGDRILTVSLSGYINYLDRNTGQLGRVIKGHNKPIVCMAVTEDKSTLFTGAMDSQIYGWNPATGECEKMKGKGHGNQVQDMAIAGDKLITVGIDDVIMFNSISSNEFGSSTPLPSQPRGLAVLPNGVAVVACLNHMVVVENGNIMFMQEVKYEPNSVDICPGGAYVAVGASKGKRVLIYELDGMTLRETDKPKVRCSQDTDEGPLCLKFSPDGAYLAVGGTKKSVALFNVLDNFASVYSVGEHRSRINTIAWAPDSQHFATGSLDQGIIVWTLNSQIFKQKAVRIDGAHKQSMCNGLAWLSDNILVSCGQDSCIKQFDITF